MSPTEPTPPSADHEKVSILMVDDSPDKLLAMESILVELGQNIVKARSGEEALRILLKQDFALILLDVNMPGIDGFETAQIIRKRKSTEHTPIIFVTSLSTTDADVFKGYAFGAVDYILFRPKAAWRVVGSEVLNEPVASDHRPVLSRLELANRE